MFPRARRSPLALIVLFAALCGVTQTSVAGAQTLPDGVRVVRDIEYARTPQKTLLLDIYQPEASTMQPRPLIVWIHGGAWRAGNKDRCPAAPFVNDGYIVASISYRLSQEAIFPAQIHDSKAAIRWLRENAAKYHIDPERIGVWGSSAGGHLVALLGTSGGVAELEGDVGGNADQSSRVQAVVDFFGPTDFLQMDAHSIGKLVHDAPDSPESQLVGGPIQQNPEKVRAANPITYVSKDDPPMLIVHGDEDASVPHHQSELLYAALQQAGVESEFYTVKGGKHGFGGEFQTPGLQQRVLEFFNRHLRDAAK